MGLIWSNNSVPLTSALSTEVQEHQSVQNASLDEDDVQRKKEIQLELLKFKKELEKKREARRDALNALGQRMAELREEKEKQQEEKEKLKEEVEKLKINDNETNKRVKELEIELELEKQEKETLRNEVENLKRYQIEEKLETVKSEEVEGLERHVKALKDVAGISAEMLRIREMQVNELKAKLAAIEETGQAYEKEVDNMRRLRALYEERARAISISHKMELDREKARLVASEAKLELAEQRVTCLEERKTELTDTIANLDKSLDEAKAENSELRLELAGKREELYNATSQMAIVNQLFSQVLSGPDGLERVTRVLEEHHDLVNHLTAKGKINDLASTLLELADQGHEPTEEEKDIAANLSKVWRLLVELLGHHVKPTAGGNGDASPNSCYKSVDTPKGPKLVISVSQTFLRLKDLILEKNSLVKEVGRLKELNSTLETRLVEQESRLAVVAAELHTTWDVVNRLKAQHKHLHTNEKVLRYELAQKRLLLNELKKELENCKESWELARAKNSQTEEDWRILRKEFASRKQISSAESGYEESPGDSQDEEESSWSNKEEVENEAEDISRDEEDPDSEDIKDTDAKLSSIENNKGADGSSEKTDHKPTEQELTINDGGIASAVELPEEQEKEMKEEPPKQQRTAEEILQAREARLKRLEEQCKGLFTKMNQTSQRSDIITNRLVELHEHYGSEEGSRQMRKGCEPKTDVSPSANTNNNGVEQDQELASGSNSIQVTPSGESSQTVLAPSVENLPKPSPDLDPDPKT